MDDFNESFVIDDDKKANWALKKIKEETAEHDRLMAIITAEREELDKKAAALDTRLANNTSFLKGQLYAYFETVDRKATKTQETYKLLDGTLVYKKPSVSIAKPEDEARLIAYLEENAPEMVKTEKTAAWGDFKKGLTLTDDGMIVDQGTGEVLEFLTTQETAGKFDVKVEG